MFHMATFIFIFLQYFSATLAISLIDDSPRLLIGSGKAITRNMRRITDISAQPDLHQDHITVRWNLTPEAFPCCAFTILELYPLDGNGVKITGETVVLLKANITSYTINATTTNVSDYLVCIRLWHRFAGQEKKLDEGCIKAHMPGGATNSSTNLMIIIFAVVVTVNITLILTLIAVKLLRSSRRREIGSFTLGKWWNDLTDLLSTAGRTDDSGRSSVTNNSGILEPRNNTVNFLPSPYFTHRIVKPPHQSAFNIEQSELFAHLENPIRRFSSPALHNVLHQEREVNSSADSGISGNLTSNATTPTLAERSVHERRGSHQVPLPMGVSTISGTLGGGCHCSAHCVNTLQAPQWRTIGANDRLFVVTDRPNILDHSRIAIV